MVERVVQELEKLGIADNTYIIYITDNGYHLSQHRLQPGKSCGFETDIHIPLLIRGPQVPKGAFTDVVTSHTDLAPTILQMAGVAPRPSFDGTAVPLSRKEINKGLSARSISLGNTYKGIRVQGKDYSFYYAVHCTNEHEMYDMMVRGGVKSLKDALHAKYDDFYMKAAEENSVSYSMCANGYIVGAEGPQDPFVYQAADWSALT
ncbi:hypothetical protein ACHAQA_005579 [Verticillium albo-atrum]